MKRLLLLFAFTLLYHTINSQSFKQKENFTLAIHGGAGIIERQNMSPEMEANYRQKLEEALLVGYAILEKGGTSIDAVVSTIKILEDSPLFNAGKGAVFTNDEKIEHDAAIMDGKNLTAGAVASVTTVKNPITAALEVMKNSPHVLLSGAGADQFAKERGLELVSPEYFYDKKRFDQLKKIKEKQQGYYGSEENLDLIYPDFKYGTVGAVALDKHGNIATGTSTGGMTNKKWGQIGDSPIIGAGTYADNETCGVSGTGHGEFFIRYQVAYDIAALMKYKNLSLQDAANEVVMNKLKDAGGSGGIIALDKEGNVAMPFNTSGMYRGVIRAGQNPKVYIFKDEK